MDLNIIDIMPIIRGKQIKENIVTSEEYNNNDDIFQGCRITLNCILKDEESPVTTYFNIGDLNEKKTAYIKTKEEIIQYLNLILTNAEKIEGKIIRY